MKKHLNSGYPEIKSCVNIRTIWELLFSQIFSQKGKWEEEKKGEEWYLGVIREEGEGEMRQSSRE